MVRSYVQTPENWDRITRTIVYNKEECLQSMVCAGKCLFLDTCTIMQYENLSTDSKFYQYISDTYDMVLVTRTILMELTSEDKYMKEIHILFLERVHETKRLYLFDEEWSYDYLKIAYDKTDKEFNQTLQSAIRFAISSYTNIIKDFMSKEKCIKYFNERHSDELYTDFFTNIRDNKQTGDSMGEELIAITAILLSSVPESSECKFELVSNDRQSYMMMRSTKQHIRDKYGWDAFNCKTTCSLGFLMFKNQYLELQELRDFTAVSYHDCNAKFFGVGCNDIECKQYTLTLDEYINTLNNDKTFKVIF